MSIMHLENVINYWLDFCLRKSLKVQDICLYEHLFVEKTKTLKYNIDAVCNAYNLNRNIVNIIINECVVFLDTNLSVVYLKDYWHPFYNPYFSYFNHKQKMNILDEFLEQGLNVNSASIDHRKILQKYLGQCVVDNYHRIAYFQTYIDLGANFNVFDKEGNTMMHYVSDYLNDFIKAGGDYNKRNKVGQTPLVHKLYSKHFNKVSLELIKKGASVSILDYTYKGVRRICNEYINDGINIKFCKMVYKMSAILSILNNY